MPTDGKTRFQVAIVNPGPIPDRGHALQASHINLAMFACALLKRLYTCIFPTGRPHKTADPVLLAIHDAEVPPTSLGAIRSEPTLSRKPLLIGFDEEPDDTARPPTSGREASRAIGLLGSLAIHLWPLLFLLEWNGPPGEISSSIPVEFVIEQAASEPVAVMQPAPTALPVTHASDDLGETAPEPDKHMITAAARPIKQTSAPPTRAPPKQTVAKPSIVRPQPVPGVARLSGFDATRDEYMAHCLSVLRHYTDGMVPPSLFSGRTGQAVLELLVLRDGTIARITVVQSSGFSDLDRGLEEMVATVRSFPPPPQGRQGAMLMTYHVVFADGLLR